MEEKLEINTQNKVKKPKKKLDPKKKVKIIIISMIAALIVCALLIWLIDAFLNKGAQYEAPDPVDPSKLWETKDEDFDIMEYDEYLKLNRSIVRYDKNAGTHESVSDDMCHIYGEAFEVVYRIIKAINAGDHVVYNYYIGNSLYYKEDFPQQQLYDITIIPQGSERVSSNGVSYDEYVFEVTYRIHENDGTFRNTIEPDASRPEYYYVNNKSGEYKVDRIIEQGKQQK